MIKNKLQDIFRDIFDDETIEIFGEMTAMDIEDWDSLMHITLILEIEKCFKVVFTTEDVTETKNVGEFIALIERKME